MRTVKEVSELTGISVRTLHWYDEIGLFKPTATSEAGYRLYDDKALETLQHILFFREFEMPLKDIKAILEAPDFDREAVLQSQKKMLELKRDRLNRLIASIEGILKGENNMDFGIFSKAEIEEMYQALVSHMTDEMKETLTAEFGSLEKYREHFHNFVSSEKGQKHYQKVMELYGDKESMLQATKYPVGAEIVQAYQNRIDAIMKKLVRSREQGLSADAFEVREAIGEYGFIMKQMTGMKKEKEIMTGIARDYKGRKEIAEATDEKYGEGMTEYFVNAVEEFYK
ncbi:MAG: MerR family transcriptional regulator [Lachnospiraceae bacterium]|nr:MerR family transcriptional regulator [Lachnospiraceae bacterium]